MRASLAWLLWLSGLALLIYGVLESAGNPWEQVSLGLGGAVFGVVGLILVLRTRGIMGWLFLVTQVLMAISISPIETSSSELFLVIAWILLIFPGERLPSPRWRLAVWALALAAGMYVVFDLLKVVDAPDAAWLAFMLLLVPVLIASAIRIVNDYRTSLGDTRQQLKWLAWVFIVGGAILLISLIPVPYLDDAHDLAGVVLIVGSPLAIGLAVSRYRLYDVDRLISRTLEYFLVVGALGVVFVAGSVWLPAVIVGDHMPPVFVAGSTLAVAALFTPLRRRIQGWVDRRFNRARYDMEMVAAEFGSQLRDGAGSTQVLEGWLRVVIETMQPSAIGVWTRGS